MKDRDLPAFPVQPVKGSALRNALAARLQAKVPAPESVVAWNVDRRRRRLSTRDAWTGPPDLISLRVAVCIIGSDEHGIDIADGVAREISRRGYLLGPADDCDLVVAVATAESRKALDDWSSDSPAPWGAALRRSVDAGVPLLILWRSGDGSPFAAEEMVDIRSDDLGTALEDSLPELKVMLIGMRGDDTFKVRSTDFGGARRQLEELDGTGQFVNLQTVVVIPTDSDTRAGESTVANLDQILDQITAEADEGRRSLSLPPDAPVPLPSSVYVTPPWADMASDLRRVREENERKKADTWNSARRLRRRAERQGVVPEIPVMGKPRLFVGYRWGEREHESWVEQFAGELYRRGYDVLFDRDPDRLDSKSDPADLLYRIAECTHFVAVITTSYLDALRSASIGDAPWARPEVNWARREWDKARSLHEDGFIGLVAARRSGTGLPAEIDQRFVADLRTATAGAELDRLFPPLLVTLSADLGDGQWIEVSPPVPHSRASQVAEALEQKFRPRNILAHAAPVPLTEAGGKHGTPC